MRDVSVPAFGSVTPNDMTISPVAIRGRYLRLSASEPCLITGIGGKKEKRGGGGPGGAAPGAETPRGQNRPSGAPRAGAPDPARGSIPHQPPPAHGFTQPPPDS